MTRHWQPLSVGTGYTLEGLADLVKVAKVWWLRRPGMEPVSLGRRPRFDDAENIITQGARP